MSAVAADAGIDLDVDSAGVAPSQWIQLSQLLETMPVIEQAKGMMMNHYRVDAPTAFQILRRWSSTTNTKLHLLCTALVHLSTEMHDMPFDVMQQHIETLTKCSQPSD